MNTSWEAWVLTDPDPTPIYTELTHELADPDGLGRRQEPAEDPDQPTPS